MVVLKKMRMSGAMRHDCMYEGREGVHRILR